MSFMSFTTYHKPPPGFLTAGGVIFFSKPPPGLLTAGGVFVILILPAALCPGSDSPPLGLLTANRFLSLKILFHMNIFLVN